MSDAVPAARVEEFVNALTHGLGLVGAVAVTPVLIVGAVGRGGPGDVVGAAVFGASLIVLYLASTAFHAARPGPGKRWLQRVDHAAIHLLIAGTYTPFTLGVLGGGWGWTLFGLVWGAAGVGMVAKLTFGARWPRASTASYLVLGWLVLVAVHPLVTRVPWPGLLWLVAGGLSYSLGVVFYLRRAPWAHPVWHLFVMGGSACHVVSVLGWAV